MKIHVVWKEVIDEQSKFYLLDQIDHILPVGSFYKHPTRDLFFEVKLILSFKDKTFIVCGNANQSELKDYFSLFNNSSLHSAL